MAWCIKMSSNELSGRSELDYIHTVPGAIYIPLLPPFPQLLQQRTHILWQFRFQFVNGPVCIGKYQPVRMQSQPAQYRPFFPFVFRQLEISFDGRKENRLSIAV